MQGFFPTFENMLNTFSCMCGCKKMYNQNKRFAHFCMWFRSTVVGKSGKTLPWFCRIERVALICRSHLPAPVAAAATAHLWLYTNSQNAWKCECIKVRSWTKVYPKKAKITLDQNTRSFYRVLFHTGVVFGIAIGFFSFISITAHCAGIKT